MNIPNLSQLSKLQDLKKHMDRFQKNHPKLPLFFRAVMDNALEEGTIVEMRVTTPEGKTYETNLKLKADDIDSIRTVQEMQESFKES